MTEHNWTGEDRRITRSVCSLHANLEKKLDEILSRQISQVEDIAHIKSVVDNGLTTALSGAVDAINKMRVRMEIIDQFTWFGEWVTQLRNNLFKRTLQLAVAGGIFYAVIHFGNKVLLKLLG